MAKNKNITSKIIYKTISGKRTKYTSVTFKQDNKTINKQFKWRGGNKYLYEKLALLPAGKVYINYIMKTILKDPTKIDKLIHQSRIRDIQLAQGKKVKKRSKKEILKSLKYFSKTIKPKFSPLMADPISKLLDKKVFYNKRHNLLNFASKPFEDKFLTNILNRATRNIKNSKKLLQNFDKIKIKMSYLVTIEGVEKGTSQETPMFSFSTIGKKPSQIYKELEELNLLPQENYINVYTDVIKNNSTALKDFQRHVNSGDFRVTNVTAEIKFYNNPQTMLRKV